MSSWAGIEPTSDGLQPSVLPLNYQRVGNMEFDGVLVDAPCSGSGALCREPDARWRIDHAAVARFQETQGAAPRRRRAGGSPRRAGLRHLLDLPRGRGGSRRAVPGRESGLPAGDRGAALAPPQPGRRLLPGEARAASRQGPNPLDGARGGALESALLSGVCTIACPQGG